MSTENGAVADEAAEERRVTDRVILQRVSVLVIPEGVEPEKLGEAIRLLMPKGAKRRVPDAAVDAWVEVARHAGATKRAAIVAHTGEPGTADALVGEFRAPSATAWKGGLRLTAPPRPLVEVEAIE